MMSLLVCAARLTAVRPPLVVQSFYKHVLREETDLADKDFKRYMKYFLNFPKDDTVSVAKYASLVPSYAARVRCGQR